MELQKIYKKLQGLIKDIEGCLDESPKKQTTITPSIIHSEIFVHWKNEAPRKHNKLTDKMRRAINAAMKEVADDTGKDKDGCVEEIKAAISAYALISTSEDYWWEHRTWKLEEFLRRGLSKFISSGKPFETFKKPDHETVAKPIEMGDF